MGTRTTAGELGLAGKTLWLLRAQGAEQRQADPTLTKFWARSVPGT